MNGSSLPGEADALRVAGIDWATEAGNPHVILRSHGGSDDLGNQTALCAPHHLRGVHGGRIRVSGTAPDRLVWELADGTPLGPGWRRDHP